VFCGRPGTLMMLPILFIVFGMVAEKYGILLLYLMIIYFNYINLIGPNTRVVLFLKKIFTLGKWVIFVYTVLVALMFSPLFNSGWTQ
jgi:hypothetical protein